MKTVLRNNPDGSISHVYFCTISGTNIYITKEARDRMFEFGQAQLNEYYSGDDHDEVESLKEDMAQLLSGECSVELHKFSIAKSIGFIKSEEILEING